MGFDGVRCPTVSFLTYVYHRCSGICYTAEKDYVAPLYRYPRDRYKGTPYIAQAASPTAE